MPPLEPALPRTVARWADVLRAHGLRVTPGRAAALEHLETHPHSSVAQVHSALAPRLPSLSQQSVHNIANALTERGILRRIDLPDAGGARYETRTGDNHHHLQCVVGKAPCLSPDDAHDMRVVEAVVIFRGICADCDASEPATHAAGGARDDHSI